MMGGPFKRILALDCSQNQAALALLVDDKMRSKAVGQVSVVHSEALLPLVDQTLRLAALSIQDIDLFATGVGPGSFTGIRVGLATMKAFSQVTGKKMLPLSSLKLLAFSAIASLGSAQTGKVLIACLVKAYEGKCFIGHGFYVFSSHSTDQKSFGIWESWQEGFWEPNEWYERNQLSSCPEKAIFCGNGAGLIGKIGEGIAVLPVPSITPEGLAVASFQALEENPAQAMEYRFLKAQYIRPSKAEENLVI